MRKITKTIRNVCVLLATPFVFSSCENMQTSNKSYDWSTKYAVEEHIKRIEERTADIFDADIINAVVKGFSVDIVYSIQNDMPIYFVVEVEYAEEFIYVIRHEESSSVCEITHYKHIMGYIYQEEYYLLEPFYVSTILEGYQVEYFLKLGPSPYSVFAQSGSKKYYGHVRGGYVNKDEYIGQKGVYGVRIGEDIVEIATTQCLQHKGCFDIHKEEIAKYSPEINCMAPPSNKVILKEDYSKYIINAPSKTLRYHDDAVTQRPHC